MLRCYPHRKLRDSLAIGYIAGRRWGKRQKSIKKCDFGRSCRRLERIRSFVTLSPKVAENKWFLDITTPCPQSQATFDLIGLNLVSVGVNWRKLLGLLPGRRSAVMNDPASSRRSWPRYLIKLSFGFRLPNCFRGCTRPSHKASRKGSRLLSMYSRTAPREEIRRMSVR